jgi:hypothetical protein
MRSQTAQSSSFLASRPTRAYPGLRRGLPPPRDDGGPSYANEPSGTPGSVSRRSMNRVPAPAGLNPPERQVPAAPLPAESWLLIATRSGDSTYRPCRRADMGRDFQLAAAVLPIGGGGARLQSTLVERNSVANRGTRARAPAGPSGCEQLERLVPFSLPSSLVRVARHRETSASLIAEAPSTTLGYSLSESPAVGAQANRHRPQS